MTVYKISRNYGLDKYFKNPTLPENTNSKDNNNLDNPEISNENNPQNENPENLKEFCVKMESLCESYEKEIELYKKKFEEINSKNTENELQLKKTNSQENKSKIDACTNTDDLCIDTMEFLLNRIDKNLKIKNVENNNNNNIIVNNSSILDEEEISEIKNKNKHFKNLIDVKEEKISELEEENLKLKNLITNFFNDEEISRLDKMDRKFQSYNNHINSLMDELISFKKNEMPFFKFFNKETLIDNKVKPIEKEKPVEKINTRDNNLSVSNNFATYFKKINPKKDSIIPQNPKDSNKLINQLNKQQNFTNKIIIDLISEILFIEYKQEYLSINFSSINTHVVENFNVILNSIFLNEKNSSKNIPIDSNFSIYHEYLQDIFFKIYQIYLREKLSYNNIESRVILPKDNNFMITDEFLNEEMIDLIVEEVSNENSFFLLVYDAERDFLPLDEWFDFKIENLLNNNFKNENNNQNNLNDEDFNIEDFSRNSNNLDKFSKFNDKISDNNYNNFQNNRGNNNIFPNFDFNNLIKSRKEEIKDNFTKRLDVLYDKFKYDIKTIISKAKINIHAGKIVCRNNILYDFSKYYMDYSSIEIKNNEILYNQMNMSQNNNSIISFDNLNYNLKYNRNNFKGLYYSLDSRLKQNFATPKNISLNNTLIYLFNYSLSSLNTLSIRDYNFDQESLLNLNKLIEFTKNLINLDISTNRLEDSGVRIICESLKLNKSIKSLNIGYNNISSNGAFYLGEFFIKNNFIERILISGNNISGSGLQNLTNVLANHKSLRFLDISNNKLLHNDILSVSNLIAKNLRLEGLNISYNFLDLNSLNQLGLSFKENKTLKFFKGTNLGLTVESSPHLLQHLSKTNIEEIFLDNNNIGETGGVLLSNVIKNNKKLKFVSVKNCSLNPIALTCICHAFEMNKNFNNLNLDSNTFDYDSIDYLCCSLKDKDIKVNLSMATLNHDELDRIKGIENINLV